MSRDIIRELYELTPNERDLVKEEKSKEAGCWELTDYSQLKEKIFAHLMEEQEGVCCYCKKKLSYHTRQTHIEHVISKDRNSRFTYHLRNLALVCLNCNTSKGAKVVYLDENTETNLRRYPRGSTNILIPHPHFDNYSDYIEFAYGFYPIPVNNNIKGVNLIDMCNLDQLNWVLDRITTEVLSNTEIELREDLRDLLKTPRREMQNKLEKIVNDLFDFYEVD